MLVKEQKYVNARHKHHALQKIIAMIKHLKFPIKLKLFVFKVGELNLSHQIPNKPECHNYWNINPRFSFTVSVL
jgi:hypothetical protein